MKVRVDYKLSVIGDFSEEKRAELDRIVELIGASVGEAAYHLEDACLNIEGSVNFSAKISQKSFKELKVKEERVKSDKVRESDPKVSHPVSGREILRSELIRQYVADGIKPSKICKVLRESGIPCSQKYVFSLAKEPVSTEASESVDKVIRKRGPGGRFIKMDTSAEAVSA